VFVSSHLLAEIEQVCTHAAIMRAGRLVAQGSLDDLRRGSGPRVAVETPDGQLAASVLGRFGLDAAPAGPGLVEAALGDAAPPAEELSAALVRDGVRLRGFAVRASSLEERFVELTGEGFDVEQ
jgi:ABC-2 type transport system ATP-binding protein